MEVIYLIFHMSNHGISVIRDRREKVQLVDQTESLTLRRGLNLFRLIKSFDLYPSTI